MLVSLWRFITDAWSSPKRARLLYVAFTGGFVVMAIAGAIRGDALVLALGVVFALIAGSIAVFAPKLAPWFSDGSRKHEADG